MGDCHLNYTACDEKACKYSYSPWCPSCEHPSPRRRCRSETAPCRRSRENAHPEDQPWPPYRHLRHQLCELPTSYIANNCQTKPHADVKHADRMNQDDLIDVIKCEKQRFRRPAGRPDLGFDTRTYFDRCGEAGSLGERYARELASVRATIADWKESVRGGARQKCSFTAAAPALYSDRLQARYVREIDAMKVKLEEYRGQARPPIAVQQSEFAPRPQRVSVKTKTPKSGVRSGLRKKKPVIRSAAKSRILPDTPTESDGSDLESDEEELQVRKTDEEGEESDELSEPLCNENKIEQGSGDISGWPIRNSLFPNIPPYVKFNTHDSEAAFRMPTARKLFKWKLSTITPIIVRKTITNSGFALVRKSNTWMGTWGKHMKSPMFQTLKETQKLNHFPGTFQLGRKDRLWRNFQKHINKYGAKEFGFIPQSYVLPQELKVLKQNWECKNGTGNEVWIIKPPAAARGVGIKVINKWSHLPKKQSLVVQRYISNPYLINGSKFDLRLYVLVTSFHPLRIYLYPDGLARFASAKYSGDAKDLKERYIHLTNYSINKLSSQYTANEDANACQGHKWTLTKLFEYLRTNDRVDTKALWRELQDLVIKTMITGEAPITELCKENMKSIYNCYELFGVDVLLDENLKPWLLEVNISPSLHSTSPLDAHVKGPMVQMLFDLAQFQFPPRLATLPGVESPPDTLETKLYTQCLTKKEKEKHLLFEQYAVREDYLSDILQRLTGDDVRKLTQAEDEWTVMGRFERIFPTSQSYKYLDFMEARYYNRLFDAWEQRYARGRQAGVEVLRGLCEKRVHLKVAPQGAINKNLPSTNQQAANQPQQKEELNHRPLAEFMQEIKIDPPPNPSFN